jgi:hypothetical protein
MEITAGLRSFDDVFDGLRVDDARTESRKILGVLGGVESVCILGSSVRRPLSIAIDNFGDAARLALLNLTQAQLDSIEQRVPGTTDARIEDISRRKGANTMLLFAMQVNPGMTIERRNCYEELGFLMQLIDDYTDVHIDKAEGVSTLLTGKQSDFERILLLQRQVRKVRALFAAEYPPDKLLDINAYIGLLLEGAGIARMQC